VIDPAVPLLGPAALNGPTVSVVMPTYRRAHQIGDSIQSLLQGTWSDFELLVCDDGGGTDGTREAVEIASDGDSRVKYHRNPQRLGMPGNLNAGIAQTVGSYIAVCHDHDLYAPDFLSAMIHALGSYPTALYVHCAIAVVDQEGNITGEHVAEWPPLTAGKDWLRFMLQTLHSPVCALTLVRRQAHQEYGLYDSAYGLVADVELWLRLATHGDVAYLATPLIRVREREANHWAKEQGSQHIKSVAAAQRRHVSHAGGSLRVLTRRLRIEANLARALLRNRVHLLYRAHVGPSPQPSS
jgi:glycosyltransferase involved in cell wall biosynthesis